MEGEEEFGEAAGGAEGEVGGGGEARVEEGKEPCPVLLGVGASGVKVREEEGGVGQVEVGSGEEELVDGTVLRVGGVHQDLKAVCHKAADDA